MISTTAAHLLKKELQSTAQGQTPTQQTQSAAGLSTGVNNAGKVALAVFMPLAGIMILCALYYIFFSDKIKACMERKKARNVSGIEMQAALET